MNELKQKLFQEHKYDMGYVEEAKVEKAFQLAWDYGHSNGEGEVRNYFNDLMDLLSN